MFPVCLSTFWSLGFLKQEVEVQTKRLPPLDPAREDNTFSNKNGKKVQIEFEMEKRPSLVDTKGTFKIFYSVVKNILKTELTVLILIILQ